MCDMRNRKDDNDTVSGIAILDTTVIPEMRYAEVLMNQYAFKPTGSNTAALVFLMHRVTKLLEENDYVRCLMIDFSKAFDMVDHVILLPKLIKIGSLISLSTGFFFSYRSEPAV